MALTRQRLQSADLVLTCPETSFRSAQEHGVRAFTPSALTTGDFTEANVAADLVGKFVYAEDGDARSCPAQVKSVSGTTATYDRTMPSTSGVSRIRAWAAADIPVRVTTADAAGPAIDIISADHQNLTNEPDGHWATGEWMLVCLGGANAGRAFVITGFTAASGTFAGATTTAGFTSSSVGDLWVIRQMVKTEGNVNVQLSVKTIERGFIGTGEIAADVPVPITSDGSISVELAAQSLGTAGASGVQAGRPMNLYSLLDDMFQWRRDTGGTAAAADATTVSLTGSALTQGGFLLLNNGQAIQIFATANSGEDVAAYGPGQLAFSQVLASSVAHASAWCSRKNGDFRTRTWDVFLAGAERHLLQGSMAKVITTLNREELLKFKFDYTAAESWGYMLDRPVAVGAANPLLLPDLTIPTNGNGMRVVLDGIEINMVNLSIDWAFTPVLRPSLRGVNQSDGCYMDKQPSIRATFKVLADDNDRAGMVTFADRIRRRKYNTLLVQKGSAPKETQCFGMPAGYFTKCDPMNDGGALVYDCEMVSVKPYIAFGSNTYANLPEASIGWL